MRLIDADELITQMCWKLGLGDEENGANVDYMEALEDCKELINNAPTVRLEYVPNYANCESVAMVRVSRPQGEWIENVETSCGKILRWRANVIEQKCNKCNRYTLRWSDTLTSEFCSNCGADMRKGGEYE